MKVNDFISILLEIQMERFKEQLDKVKYTKLRDIPTHFRYQEK